MLRPHLFQRRVSLASSVCGHITPGVSIPLPPSCLSLSCLLYRLYSWPVGRSRSLKMFSSQNPKLNYSCRDLFQIRPHSEVLGVKTGTQFWGAPLDPPHSLNCGPTPFSSLRPCRVSSLWSQTGEDQGAQPPVGPPGPLCSMTLHAGIRNCMKERCLLIFVTQQMFTRCMALRGQITSSWVYSYGFLWMVRVPEPVSRLADPGRQPCSLLGCPALGVD